jgi:hypothetical protein
VIEDRCPVCHRPEHNPAEHSRAERRAAGERTVRRTGQVFLHNSSDGVRQISAEEHLANAAAYEVLPEPASFTGQQTPPIDETAEPCFGCSCCASWSTALEQLRTAVTNHEFARTVGGTCDKASCLVCQAIDGQWVT